MQSVWKSKGEKLSTRNIEVTTYDYDEERIIVEGTLRDDRFHDTHGLSGETFPRGVVHHMAIRLLVHGPDRVIEDVDVELISVPREVCRETINCLASIKGLSVTKGFTSKIKNLAGGKKGCTHLVALLLSMAPAVFQGFATHRTRKPASIDPHQAKMIYHFLVNTCHAWREDGPFAETFKKRLDLK
jgi:hypothetical protein